MKKTLLFVTSLILFSCGEKTTNETTEKKETIESKGSDGAHYKIIYLNNYYNNYLSAVKKDYTNKRKIYDETILNALKKDFFAKSEYCSFFEDAFTYFVPDTAGMEHVLNGIKTNKKEIDNRISQAINRCKTDLNNDSITIYIQPPGITGSQMLTRMGGVTGLTIGSKQILLTIDTDVPAWDEALEHYMSRELYKAFWTKNNYDTSYKWTLLRHIVLEGKADSYTHHIFPNAKIPWAFALSNIDKSKLWKKIKPRLDAKNSLYLMEVMFGSNNYPAWGGYTMGYTLVQNVLEKNNKLKFEELNSLEAEKILDMSDWK